MNMRLVRTGIAMLALILVAASFVQAAPGSVEVKFKFIVSGRVLEPGVYRVDIADGGKVVLTPEQGGAVELAQVKSLGRKKISKAQLVFEEMGSTMYLAEVWMPEKDGVKVGEASGAERRVTVSAKSEK